MIIFDCDGVLVETEALFAESDATVLAERGIIVPAQELLNRYTGVLYEDMVADMIARYPGVDQPLADHMRVRARQRLQQGVDAVPGIKAVVQAMHGRCCVASNSSLVHIKLVLAHIGLEEAFGTHLYSAYMVPRPKPYPDLHMLCAERLDTPPERCIVIEDSATGIQAAKAAGMHAIGLTAARHMQEAAADKLWSAGADHVVSTSAALLPLIESLSVAA